MLSASHKEEGADILAFLFFSPAPVSVASYNSYQGFLHEQVVPGQWEDW